MFEQIYPLIASGAKRDFLEAWEIAADELEKEFEGILIVDNKVYKIFRADIADATEPLVKDGALYEDFIEIKAHLQVDGQLAELAFFRRKLTKGAIILCEMYQGEASIVSVEPSSDGTFRGSSIMVSLNNIGEYEFNINAGILPDNGVEYDQSTGQVVDKKKVNSLKYHFYRGLKKTRHL